MSPCIAGQLANRKLIAGRPRSYRFKSLLLLWVAHRCGRHSYPHPVRFINTFLSIYINGLGIVRALHQPLFFCNCFVSAAVYKLLVTHAKPVVGAPLAPQAHFELAVFVSVY